MERFITSPNLPEGRVSLMVVDGRIASEMEKTLMEKGIRLIKTLPIKEVMPEVAWHPDIMLHHMGQDRVVVAPNAPEKLVYALEEEKLKIITGKRELRAKYPMDIPYNVARLGKFAICSIKNTDEVLLEKLQEEGMQLIDVSQGYSKCSICIVDSSSIITSDKGITKASEAEGINVLLIEPGNIELKGMDYGFIGGATGFLSLKELAFAGCLEKNPQYSMILNFVLKHGKTPINLCENTLQDLGTLVPLKEYSILQA
jgi:hypothetical protein